jgi:hypothetical protein
MGLLYLLVYYIYILSNLKYLNLHRISSRSLSLCSASSSDSPPGEKDDDIHLIPLLDFANHSFTPNCSWRLENDGTIRLESLKPLVANEEITISYGYKSNEQLLFSYGFTLENNPYDAVVFSDILFLDDFLKYSRLLEKLHLSKSLFLTNQETPLSKEGKCLMLLAVILASDGLVLDESKIHSSDSLLEVLEATELIDVLLLRVFTVLIQLVENRGGELIESMERDAHVMRDYVKIMKEGHLSILTNAMEYLTRNQGEYSQKKTVINYLNAMNE